VLHSAPSYAQAPTFEAASIKPNKGAGNGSWVTQDQGENLTAGNATLKRLVMNAYGLRDFQVVGGPGFTDTDTYDIPAKPAGQTGGVEFTVSFGNPAQGPGLFLADGSGRG
jgi:uncharacterized protein (TIGR03435 family)